MLEYRRVMDGTHGLRISTMREEHLYSRANSRHHAHTELIALLNGIIHHHEAPVILMDVNRSRRRLASAEVEIQVFFLPTLAIASVSHCSTPVPDGGRYPR